jgi:hypothetical protein
MYVNIKLPTKLPVYLSLLQYKKRIYIKNEDIFSRYLGHNLE